MSQWKVPHADLLDPSDAASRSYWVQDAIASEPAYVVGEPLTSSVRADVCIVGGGLTGLWTAIELKQRDPSTEVVLIEASLCGAGASGANAGMMMNLWAKLPALLRAGGEAEGLDVARASVDAIDYIERFCADNEIDAEFERNGWLWVSNNSAQDGSWNDTVEFASSFSGSPFTNIGSDTATRLAGAPVRGAVMDATCAGVHPARLVRGLLRVARSLGVVVYEHSPMTELITEHGVTRVRSTMGSVTADSVVLAINAWCDQFPTLRRHLLMTASDNAVVRPRADLREYPRTNVSDSGRLLDYWRSLSDGRVLFGKAGVGLGWAARGTNTQFRPVPRLKHLVEQMTRTVPALFGAEVLSSWRAPVEYSLSSLPFFGALPGYPGVFFGTGYSGDGVGPSLLGARVLASLASATDDGLASSFLTRLPSGSGLPPEPIRFVGGQLVKVAMLRKERLEDEERGVDLPTSLLSRIDPTAFVG